VRIDVTVKHAFPLHFLFKNMLFMFAVSVKAGLCVDCLALLG